MHSAETTRAASRTLTQHHTVRSVQRDVEKAVKSLYVKEKHLPPRGSVANVSDQGFEPRGAHLQTLQPQNPYAAHFYQGPRTIDVGIVCFNIKSPERPLRITVEILRDVDLVNSGVLTTFSVLIPEVIAEIQSQPPSRLARTLAIRASLSRNADVLMRLEQRVNRMDSSGACCANATAKANIVLDRLEGTFNSDSVVIVSSELARRLREVFSKDSFVVAFRKQAYMRADRYVPHTLLPPIFAGDEPANLDGYVATSVDVKLLSLRSQSAVCISSSPLSPPLYKASSTSRSSPPSGDSTPPHSECIPPLESY
jgi:hypothetical protein